MSPRAWKYALLVSLVLYGFIALMVLFASKALANTDRAADVARMNAIVDAWFHGQPCANGEGVVMDPNLPPDRDGEARGLDWRWNDTDYVLYRKSCDQAVRPGLSLARECYVRWHERAHLVFAQVEHDGDLAYDHAGPPDCKYLEPKPLSRRTRLKTAIHDSLPSEYAPWTVICGPNGREMNCRAESPHAKYPRRFDASIKGGYSFSTVEVRSNN